MCIGLGVVVRNEVGLVLAAGAQPLQLCVSPQIAEAMVVLRGIQFASKMGIYPIVVECDSLSIVNIRFQDCFRSSSANSVAHGLSKLALSLSHARFWLEDYPSCVENLVLGDYPV
ncbi:hypothetical protein ACOSQ2_028994 [Xanthoceras sorbifolium]